MGHGEALGTEALPSQGSQCELQSQVSPLDTADIRGHPEHGAAGWGSSIPDPTHSKPGAPPDVITTDVPDSTNVPG